MEITLGPNLHMEQIMSTLPDDSELAKSNFFSNILDPGIACQNSAYVQFRMVRN